MRKQINPDPGVQGRCMLGTCLKNPKDNRSLTEVAPFMQSSSQVDPLRLHPRCRVGQPVQNMHISKAKDLLGEPFRDTLNRGWGPSPLRPSTWMLSRMVFKPVAHSSVLTVPTRSGKDSSHASGLSHGRRVTGSLQTKQAIGVQGPSH